MFAFDNKHLKKTSRIYI